MDEQQQAQNAQQLMALLAAGGSTRGFMPPPTSNQLKRQGFMKAGAGIADIIQGKRNQAFAEEQIEDLGGQQEELIQQYKDLNAPSLMDPNTVAAATRNAAILGGVPAQPDASAEMAAAKMAMEAGADPATIQRNLANSQLQEQQMAAQNAQQNFQQGLGMAQQDAQNQFAKQQDNLMMDLDDVSSQLEAAQRESLMAQQQQQGGTSNLFTGGTQYLQGFGMDRAAKKKKEAAEEALRKAAEEEANRPPSFAEMSYEQLNSVFNDGVDPVEEGLASPADMIPMSNEVVMGEGMTVEDYLDQLANQGQQVQEQGGVVQKTPGEFNHDTNDMVLMAPTENGLVDTGIRQTGGEFVLNPEQAEGLEEAYDDVDPEDPTYDQLLALYKAARFLDEPQFDDDYVA